MNEQEVMKIGQFLLQKYELIDWKFQINKRCKLRMGYCNFDKKVIEVSKCLIDVGTPEDIQDTILHEIAHALVGRGYGHGKVWKAKAIEIGAIPKACNSHKIKLPKGKAKYICYNCGYEEQIYRLPRKKIMVACASCCKKYNNGKFTDKFLLEIKENGN